MVHGHSAICAVIKEHSLDIASHPAWLTVQQTPDLRTDDIVLPPLVKPLKEHNIGMLRTLVAACVRAQNGGWG